MRKGVEPQCMFFDNQGGVCSAQTVVANWYRSQQREPIVVEPPSVCKSHKLRVTTPLCSLGKGGVVQTESVAKGQRTCEARVLEPLPRELRKLLEQLKPLQNR